MLKENGCYRASYITILGRVLIEPPVKDVIFETPPWAERIAWIRAATVFSRRHVRRHRLGRPTRAVCFPHHGIPGSGKTTVATALAQRFPLAAHVDEMLIAMIVSGYHPPTTQGDRESDRQILLRARNAALLIDSFAEAGVVPVFDDVVVRRSHLSFYRQMVKATPFYVVVLVPSLEVALHRDRQRGKRIAEPWEHLDADLREELKGEGLWIDSSALTIDETVDAILDLGDVSNRVGLR